MHRQRCPGVLQEQKPPLEYSQRVLTRAQPLSSNQECPEHQEDELQGILACPSLPLAENSMQWGIMVLVLDFTQVSFG